jgi:hypothetical protein
MTLLDLQGMTRSGSCFSGCGGGFFGGSEQFGGFEGGGFTFGGGGETFGFHESCISICFCSSFI